jgi:hypothetical protein
MISGASSAFNDAVQAQTTDSTTAAMITPPIFESLGREIAIRLGQEENANLPSYLGRYRWKKLKDSDKARVINVFNGMTQDKQEAMIKSIKEANRNMTANVVDVTDDIATAAKQHPILNPNTNKHDKARYIEMMADPALVALWTEAYSPYENRATLDDK